jgi:small-conductance mechanosensitive channel
MTELNSILKYGSFVVIILIVSYFLSRTLKYILGKYIDVQTKTLDNDATSYNFLKHAISFFIIVAATIIIFYTIPSLRELGLTLLASAGLIAAILGLAAQEAFANIISGIFIVIFKPFRVGDLIEITNQRGIVEDITLRHTVIRNVENRRLIIPNSVISNETIINSHIKDEKICNLVEIGISYDSNIDKAINIIQDQALKHPNCLDERNEEQKLNNEPIVIVRVLGYGESAINLRAYIWSSNSLSGFIMRCDLYKSIKDQFDKNNIEIPFPHRTIVYKNSSEEK